MQKITKQSVLKAFQEEKRIFWDDFTEKEIFFNINPESERSIQLQKPIFWQANVMYSFIMRVDSFLPIS